MSKLNFSFKGTSISATKFEGKSRQFNLVIDEPEDLGGKDSAANPVEYLLAGYAGCLNVVYNLVAREIGIKINYLSISINGDINPEKFLGISEKERSGFQSLNVLIELDSNGTPEQEQELITKAKNRCPINDNLANPTPIQYLITQPISKN